MDDHTSPTIIFDHINKVVTQTGGSDPNAAQKLAEVAAAQSNQVTTGVGGK